MQENTYYELRLKSDDFGRFRLEIINGENGFYNLDPENRRTKDFCRTVSDSSRRIEGYYFSEKDMQSKEQYQEILS